jgi:hypothetical protein
MRFSVSRSRYAITYLNVILTVIAVLMTIQLAINLGLQQATNAHAASVMPVQIESVRGTIPVAIKEPVSGYPQAVCVEPRR